MALYAIGDLHLSFGSNKPMDIFNGWDRYEEKIEANWRQMVREEDTVIIVGDISWAMSLEQALQDFQFIDTLPGKKIILKGNHDYFWSTKSKMEQFFQKQGINSISILHNNAFWIDGIHICGTRGWVLEKGETENKKIILRECGRLQASLNSRCNQAGETVVFFHYPPLFQGERTLPLIELLQENKIKRCVYGHIHGSGTKFAPQGSIEGIYYRLVSCDYTEFCPVRIG